MNKYILESTAAQKGKFYRGEDNEGKTNWTLDQKRAGKFYDKELAEKRAKELGNVKVS